MGNNSETSIWPGLLALPLLCGAGGIDVAPLTCPEGTRATRAVDVEACVRDVGDGTVLHGPWRRRFHNGRRAEAGTYRDGEKHGVWQTWTPLGTLHTSTEYVAGERHGRAYSLGWNSVRETVGRYVHHQKDGVWAERDHWGFYRWIAVYSAGERVGDWLSLHVERRGVHFPAVRSYLQRGPDEPLSDVLPNRAEALALLEGAPESRVAARARWGLEDSLADEDLVLVQRRLLAEDELWQWSTALLLNGSPEALTLVETLPGQDRVNSRRMLRDTLRDRLVLRLSPTPVELLRNRFLAGDTRRYWEFLRDAVTLNDPSLAPAIRALGEALGDERYRADETIERILASQRSCCAEGLWTLVAELDHVDPSVPAPIVHLIGGPAPMLVRSVVSVDGRAVFEDVPPGDYVVVILEPGFWAGVAGLDQPGAGLQLERVTK